MDENDIREIRGEGYSMENNEIAGGKPQITAVGKIPFREIRKEEYRKMLDENKNDNEKIHIKEIQEEGYMENKNDNEKNYIREMNEEGYSMMENEMENEINEMENEMDNDEIEREFDKEMEIDNNEMENEINDEMFNEEEYMEMKNENKIENKTLRDPQIERKFYEDNKLIYQINNIYRKCGLKINKKFSEDKNKLEEIIFDMIRYNFYFEKNENLFKNDLKKDLLDFKLRNNDDIKKICENLSKNDFTIPKKYKYKKNLAKFIKKCIENMNG